MITSFTRIVIVLGSCSVRSGSNSCLNSSRHGGSPFDSLLRYPTWNQVYGVNGLAPYLARDISAEQAWQRTVVPAMEFLFRHTRQEELSLMTSMAKLEQPGYLRPGPDPPSRCRRSC